MLGVKFQADRSSVAAVMTGNVAIDLYVDVDKDVDLDHRQEKMERASIKVLGVRFRADRSSVAPVMTGTLFRTLPWTSTMTSISSTVQSSRPTIGRFRARTTTVLRAKFRADRSTVAAVMIGADTQTDRRTALII